MSKLEKPSRGGFRLFAEPPPDPQLLTDTLRHWKLECFPYYQTAFIKMCRTLTCRGQFGEPCHLRVSAPLWTHTCSLWSGKRMTNIQNNQKEKETRSTYCWLLSVEKSNTDEEMEVFTRPTHIGNCDYLAFTYWWSWLSRPSHIDNCDYLGLHILVIVIKECY